MRRTPLAALSVVLGLSLTLAGCGDSEDKSSLGPVSDEGPSATRTPQSAEPGAEDDRPFDDEGNEAIRGSVQADTPEEEAVAQAWFAYWDARSSSYHRAEVDPALGSVAAGKAVTDVVRYVAQLKAKKLRTVGDTKFGVSEIKIEGNSATLNSCGENKSIDRDAEGRPAEQPTPFYNFAGILAKAGGSWRVVSAEVVGENGCKA